MFLHLSVSHSVHGGVSRPRPRGEVGGSGGGVEGVSRPSPGGRECPGPYRGRGVSGHNSRNGRPEKWPQTRSSTVILSLGEFHGVMTGHLA